MDLGYGHEIKTVFCILYPKRHFQCALFERAFIRAFLAILFGRLMKNSYLCIINEKRRNLRPAWATKIA